MKTDITWTDTAWEHWGAVRDRNRMIRSYFGDDLANAHDANLLDTFARVTFAAGPVNVQKDHDGFLITTPHITIGLVWTPDGDRQFLERIQITTGHDVNLDGPPPADWPRTGHWSAHS